MIAGRLRSPECDFCAEFGTEYSPLTATDAPPKSSRVIHASDGWYIVPSVGPIVEGHLLVCPQSHLTAVLDACDEQVRIADRVLSEAVRILREKFNAKGILICEHGTGAGEQQRSGACVEHAHIHVSPGPVDVINFMRDRVTIASEWHPNLVAIRANHQAGAGYLLLGTEQETDGRRLWLSETGEVLPRQWFRQVLAKAAGSAQEWDWRKTKNEETFARTLKIARTQSNWG